MRRNQETAFTRFCDDIRVATCDCPLDSGAAAQSRPEEEGEAGCLLALLVCALKTRVSTSGTIRRCFLGFFIQQFQSKGRLFSQEVHTYAVMLKVCYLITSCRLHIKSKRTFHYRTAKNLKKKFLPLTRY